MERETVEEEAAEGGRPAVPPAPAWTQYIVPLIFILWFAFRIFGPDIKRFLSGAPGEEPSVPTESAAPAPELRRLVMCESVAQGQPVGPRSSFSRSKDKLATAFTAWTGEPRPERIHFIWRSPKNKELTGTQKLIRLPAALGSFLLVGELPIGEFTEPGPWRIEVTVDDQTVASNEFSVEP
jgi:hypothetical protein